MRASSQKMGLAGVALAAALFAGGSSAAPVVYENALGSPAIGAGMVGGFSWFLEDGANVDYWSFHAVAGDTVTIKVDRLNGNLDPTLSYYQGTTNADTSGFLNSANWGGLVFLGILDDENPPNLAGPFGDPFGSFLVTATDYYTIAVGGNGSTDAGQYPYQITVTGNTPEPMSIALMGLGLVGLGFARRRKDKTNA